MQIEDDEQRQITWLCNVAREAFAYLTDAGMTSDEAAVMAGHVAQAMQLWARPS